VPHTFSLNKIHITLLFVTYTWLVMIVRQVCVHLEVSWCVG
jgi:hypothetical protein